MDGRSAADPPSPRAVQLLGRVRTQTGVVTLIRPPMIAAATGLSTHAPTPPVGMAYIAAALRQAGHEVHTVDGQGEAIDRAVAFDSPAGRTLQIGLDPDEIAARIPEHSDVVGISVMFFHEWPVTTRLLQAVKARLPHVRIVLGGETATAFAPWIMEMSNDVDVIVKGEGDRTVIGVVDHLVAGQLPPPAEGIVVRTEADGAVDGGLAVRIRDLEELPRPAWDLFPIEAYIQRPAFGVNNGRSMPVLATRGCPFRCSFCSAPQMWTTRYRVREPEDVVDEIASYVDEYGITNANFVDLTAVTKRSWAVGFCDALERRKLNVTWQMPIGTRSEILDDEMLRRLKNSGCTHIAYAPESGSKRMIDIMDKRVDLRHLLASARTARRLGIRTHINIIIGHPEERWWDLAQSAAFMVAAAATGCDDAAAVQFCPYPGSADFNELVQSGRLVIDDDIYYIGLMRATKGARSFNKRIPGAALRWIQIALLSLFYGTAFLRRPQRVLEVWRSRRTGRDATYLDQMARTRRQRAKAA